MKVRKKIVEYFKNNVPRCQIAKALQISSSNVHNIIKDLQKLEKSLCVRDKAEDLCWMPVVFGSSDDTASLIGMILSLTLLKEYFQKPLSVNTIRRTICWCQLKLYHAKRKPYVNMVQKHCHVLWAKAHLKWTVSKWKSVLWSDESKFDLVEITDAVSSGLKRRRPSSVLSAFSSKASISDGMGVHKCIRYGQLAYFGRHYECWKVNKGFRAKYAPLQTTSISGKALCISAGQCKTTYCSYYNSMASW